jgi:hypothetical protein
MDHSRVAAATLLAAVFGLVVGCDSQTNRESTVAVPDTAKAPTPPELEKQIQDFCGACHAVPKPDSFPKSAWYDEVRRGYDFYFQSGRSDLHPPPQAEVTTYFRERAPAKLTIPEAEPESDVSRLKFRTQVVEAPVRGPEGAAAIAGVEWIPPGATAAGFLLTDMRHGNIQLFDSAGKFVREWRDVATNPATAHVSDVDGDGGHDLIVSDLGSFLPADHDRGRAIVVRDFLSDAPRAQTLLGKVGRVADACPGDFDGDGATDLVISEFGWHTTGGIPFLRNIAGQPSVPSPVERLDSRPGTIHGQAVDLNGDGKLDYVALISQEHETVVAFLREGDGFRKEVLHSAPDPSYGSSGIALADLDGDGDLDLLYTCGDTFDSHLVKPYHGVFWMENRGEFPFVEHRLTTLPGVHRALAADLDHDGDLDVAAVAFLPETAVRGDERKRFDSVIWLEQTSPGAFVRHSIERGSPLHTAAAVGDFDGDGDVDVAASHFLDPTRPDAVLSVYWNEGR